MMEIRSENQGESESCDFITQFIRTTRRKGTLEEEKAGYLWMFFWKFSGKSLCKEERK